MILLIDNYDSFTYNLVQVLGELEPDIRVVRNDAMTVEEIRELFDSGAMVYTMEYFFTEVLSRADR